MTVDTNDLDKIEGVPMDDPNEEMSEDDKFLLTRPNFKATRQSFLVNDLYLRIVTI